MVQQEAEPSGGPTTHRGIMRYPLLYEPLSPKNPIQALVRPYLGLILGWGAIEGGILEAYELASAGARTLRRVVGCDVEAKPLAQRIRGRPSKAPTPKGSFTV